MIEIKKYYKNGQIHEHYWVDEKGNYQGEYKSWNDNGQLSHHCFYKNDKLEGEYKEWYSNGQLAYHCFFYKDNLYEGEYKSWHFSGQLIVHCFYKNGLKNGEYKHYYDNGQSFYQQFFHDDKVVDISEYVQDINNITEEEYFLLQIIFGYFPVIKFNGTEHERN